MNRTGVIALLLGAVGIYLFFHIVFEVEAITLFYTFLLKFLALAKSFIARMTWEMVFIFSANFFKRATFKFLFIQVPLTLGIPILTMLLMKPGTKRRWKVRAELIKRSLLSRFAVVKRMFTKVFGANATIAFAASLMFAVSSFVFSMYYFGFEFFLWLGSWGPIGRFASWLWSWITYFSSFARGAIYRLPMLGTIMATLGNIWKKHIAVRLPHVEWHRRKVVKNSLRTARTSREHSMRAYMRFERRRERRKERLREIKQQRREQAFDHKLQIVACLPQQGRIIMFGNSYVLFVDRTARNNAHRLYKSTYLGGNG